MNEHNGGTDHVTWRDLDRRTAELVSHREIDNRLNDLDRLRIQAEAAVEQARQIAREQVLKHDEEKNNLLSQINRERADFTTKIEAERAIEKASLELHGVIDRGLVERKNEIEVLATTVRAQTVSIRSLENADTTQRGKDRGNLSLYVAILAVIIAIAGNVGIKVLLG